MTTWEYHVIHTNIRLQFKEIWTAKIKDEATGWEMIQQLGQEGWEMVSAFPLQSPEGGTISVAWVFKRPIPEPVT